MFYLLVNKNHAWNIQFECETIGGAYRQQKLYERNGRKELTVVVSKDQLTQFQNKGIVA